MYMLFYHWRELPQVSFLSRQDFLSRQTRHLRQLASILFSLGLMNVVHGEYTPNIETSHLTMPRPPHKHLSVHIHSLCLSLSLSLSHTHTHTHTHIHTHTHTHTHMHKSIQVQNHCITQAGQSRNGHFSQMQTELL